MQMGPSRRGQCVSWIAEAGFAWQDCEACEGVMATSRSGGGDMGTRGHHTRQLSLLV